MKTDSKVVCDHQDAKCGKCCHAVPHEPQGSDCISVGECWLNPGEDKVKLRFPNVRCRVVKEKLKA